MTKNQQIEHVRSEPTAVLRRLLLAWLTGCAMQYTFLSGELQSLTDMRGAQSLSLAGELLSGTVCFSVLQAASYFFDTCRFERRAFVAVFAWYAAVALAASFSWPLAVACVIILGILSVCAAKGAALSTPVSVPTPQKNRRAACLTAGAALLFFCLVGTWLTCRVLGYACPTYDMGIFTQMFSKMRATGLPTTTLERDGLLSHFSVHLSPIYYLMLPLYALFPSAVTLQLLQAAIAASAVLPLWRIARRSGLSGALSALACGLLLLYPSLAGGMSYDLHENIFLTPLILWLFDFAERRKAWGVALFAALTLSVKEDAAVYVAVAGLYFLLCGTVRRDAWLRRVGLGCLLGACAWFLCAAHILDATGDGVMRYRYANLISDGSDSLFSVVRTVFLLPMKALAECVESEKLVFLAQTLLPLAGLPFLTRRYERFVLFIPYLLVNLLSDYPYQHDIFFQYGYGATAFLFYLTVHNAADLAADASACRHADCAARTNPRAALAPALLAAGTVLALTVQLTTVLPPAVQSVTQYCENRERYDAWDDCLAAIPRDSTVTATTYFTLPLADCRTVYDLQYCTLEHLLSSDYVVLDDRRSFKSYATDPWTTNSRTYYEALLTAQNYHPTHSLPGLTVWQKGE